MKLDIMHGTETLAGLCEVGAMGSPSRKVHGRGLEGALTATLLDEDVLDVRVRRLAQVVDQAVTGAAAQREVLGVGVCKQIQE